MALLRLRRYHAFAWVWELPLAERSFFVAQGGTNARAVLVRHCRAFFGVGIKPVQDQCLKYPFRVRQVRCAIVLERLKQLGVEAVGPLNRLGLGLLLRSGAV